MEIINYALALFGIGFCIGAGGFAGIRFAINANMVLDFLANKLVKRVFKKKRNINDEFDEF